MGKHANDFKGEIGNGIRIRNNKGKDSLRA